MVTSRQVIPGSMQLGPRLIAFAALMLLPRASLSAPAGGQRNIGPNQPPVLTGNVLTGPLATTGPRCLYAPADVDDPSYRSQIAYAISGTCDYYDARYGTPDSTLLNGYDFVHTFADYFYQNNVLFGDRLANYVDRGGHVVLGAFCASTAVSHLAGRLMTDNQRYCPVTGGLNHRRTAYWDGTCAGDCIYRGVVSWGAFYRDSLTLRAGTICGRFTDGEIAVAVNSAHDVLYVNGSGGLPLITYGDLRLVVANAGICGSSECTPQVDWHVGPAIHIVRPLDWWPRGTDLEDLRPGDVIAFSLLAEDRDYLVQTCVDCEGQPQTLAFGPYEDRVDYQWELRQGGEFVSDSRILPVADYLGSTVLYQMPRCGWNPGRQPPLRSDTLLLTIDNEGSTGKPQDPPYTGTKIIITMRGCYYRTFAQRAGAIRADITVVAGSAPPDQPPPGGGGGQCVPTGPTWTQGTLLDAGKIAQDDLDEFCPDYVTLLSVLGDDWDDFNVSCASQDPYCREPGPLAGTTIDGLHFRWSLVSGQGEFPLSTDGPAVAFRKGRSESAVVECEVSDSGGQYEDGPIAVYRTVIKGQSPRAFVGVGFSDGFLIPSDLINDDLVAAAHIAKDRYESYGYDVTLSEVCTVAEVRAALASPCLQAIWVGGHADEALVALNPGGWTVFRAGDPGLVASETWHCSPVNGPHPFLREIVALGCSSYSTDWTDAMVCGKARSFDYTLIAGPLGSVLGRNPYDWERTDHIPECAHDLRYPPQTCPPTQDGP